VVSRIAPVIRRKASCDLVSEYRLHTSEVHRPHHRSSRPGDANTRFRFSNGHGWPDREATPDIAEGNPSRGFRQRLARVGKGQPQGPLRVASCRGEIGPSRVLQSRVGVHRLSAELPPARPSPLPRASRQARRLTTRR
jgi:hypothetical protein